MKGEGERGLHVSLSCCKLGVVQMLVPLASGSEILSIVLTSCNFFLRSLYPDMDRIF